MQIDRARQVACARGSQSGWPNGPLPPGRPRLVSMTAPPVIACAAVAPESNPSRTVRPDSGTAIKVAVHRPSTTTAGDRSGRRHDTGGEHDLRSDVPPRRDDDLQERVRRDPDGRPHVRGPWPICSWDGRAMCKHGLERRETDAGWQADSAARPGRGRQRTGAQRQRRFWTADVQPGLTLAIVLHVARNAPLGPVGWCTRSPRTS